MLEKTVKPLVVRPKEACVMLSCTAPTLYKLIGSKELESFRDGPQGWQGGRRLITVASIHAYIARKLAEQNATAAA
jgi:excisionase family DNA binding protein